MSVGRRSLLTYVFCVTGRLDGPGPTTAIATHFPSASPKLAVRLTIEGNRFGRRPVSPCRYVLSLLCRDYLPVQGDSAHRPLEIFHGVSSTRNLRACGGCRQA